MTQVLLESQSRGFLGPGPVDPHIDRALALGAPLAGITEGKVIDMGSGGGLPGLPLALARSDLEWILLEGGQTRAGFLQGAVDDLRLANTTVVAERAEVAGRGPMRYGAAALVARSFGPPAVTAECGSPLLKVGGLMVVAEPPADPDQPNRWDAAGLAVLGLREESRSSGSPAWVALRQFVACPDQYPRRTGVPAKRPLF